jgi:hypothetical protein
VILTSFLNLDWGGNIENRRPTIGFTFLLTNGVVNWMRKKKPMVASSSMEAKYMVVLSVTKKTIYLKKLLHELTFAP